MKKKQLLLLTLLLVLTATGAVWDSATIKTVREAVRLFRAGEFQESQQTFEDAAELSPDEPVIDYGKACALISVGQLSEAEDLFHRSALARDLSLSAHSHYNLGHVAAMTARKELGEDPVRVDPQKREGILADLLTAGSHYRDCLRLQADYEDARHNLELVRLYAKHIQAEWERRDREKAREELPLLPFLDRIRQRQTMLRDLAQIISQQEESPQQRQAVQEAADQQRDLWDEIEPLKQKIEEAARPPETEGTDPASIDPKIQEQQQQALQLLTQLADDAGDAMRSASSQLARRDFNVARGSQKNVLDRLHEIEMVAAPFADILQKAIRRQEQLAGHSDTLIPQPPETNAAPTVPPVASTEEPDFPPDLDWQQSRITDWSRLLSLKAEQELPHVEAQLQQPAPVAPPVDPQSASAEQTEDQQLQGLAKSLQRAIELGPQAEEHSSAAEQHLEAKAADQALPEQKQTLELLKQIAEPLKQDQDSDEQQDQDQQSGDQQQDEEQKQPDPSQSKDDSQDQQQQDQKSEQDQQSQQQQISRSQAESVLRKALEREREHRDQQKRLRAFLRGTAPVDRDW